MRPETANNSLGGGRYHRGMAEFFPRVDIRNMNFNDRNSNRPHGVMQCDRCMRVGTGIERDTDSFIARFMQPIDQIALMIALAAVDKNAELLTEPNAIRLNVGQCLTAVNPWLPLA